MSKSGAVVTSLAIGLGLVLYTLVHYSRNARQSHTQNDMELEQFHQKRMEQSALGLKETRKILAVTRVHKGSSASHMSSKENVVDFVKNSMAYASSVLICLGNSNTSELNVYMSEVSALLHKEGLDSRTTLVHINPWGRFTTALNAAVVHALEEGYDIVAFQSLEFRISPEAVRKLLSYMPLPPPQQLSQSTQPQTQLQSQLSQPTQPQSQSQPLSSSQSTSTHRFTSEIINEIKVPHKQLKSSSSVLSSAAVAAASPSSSSSSSSSPSSSSSSSSSSSRRLQYSNKLMKTLVVGPVMTGHAFTPGINKVRGRTVPWNTFALWSVSDLATTGFPLTGDGVGGPGGAIAGGVEEVTTINLLQSIHPYLHAILVQLPSSLVEWQTQNFADDPKRLQWHEEKMKSKDERPAAQMARLENLAVGNVWHIVDEG